MTRIAILGGTGFAGRHLVREAATRGHDVVAVSRREPEPDVRVEGVVYRQVDLADEAGLHGVVADADVVVATLSPRGGLAEALPGIYRRLADEVRDRPGRLFVVGGFSSLRQSPEGPRIIELGMPEVPGIPAEQLEAMLTEAAAMNSVLLGLLGRDDDLRWTFFSPGMDFGSHVPGERTGHYRVGTDGLVVVDESGSTAIGGADFAIAVLDEVESDTPREGHLAVAY